jgi:hypothetical protein
MVLTNLGFVIWCDIIFYVIKKSILRKKYIKEMYVIMYNNPFNNKYLCI